MMQGHGENKMKIKECSASKLNKLSQKKKIIFFGAGDNLFHILEVYKEYEFEKRVAFVVDGNPQKIGKTISFNGTEMEVKPYTALSDVKLKEYTLIIAALKYQEIFAQIQNISNEKNTYCYTAPKRRIGGYKLIEKLVCSLPLKDTIVLNGEGDTYDNAEALGKYIASKQYFDKYRLVWLCDHPKQYESTDKEKFLNRKALWDAHNIGELFQYYYYVGRAKYLIFENQMIPKIRTDQISIYLNHGSPPIKSTKGIINLPKDLNLAISPSEYSTDIICEQYGINKQRVLCCGSPRTDCLFDLSDVADIKEEFHISKFKKVVIWVPTFRQKKNSNRVDTNRKYNWGIPIINDEDNFEQLKKLLERENIVILLKPHLLQDISYIKLKQTENIQIITNDELLNKGRKINDLLKCADAMVTDYSTIAFDFMLLNRPIGYTVDDIEDYKIGFSVKNVTELMPGAMIDNAADLYDFLETVSIGQDVKAEQRRTVNQKVHDYPDGYNAERLCHKLKIGEKE